MGVGTSLDGALPELIFALGEMRAGARKVGIEFATAEFGGLRTQAYTTLILGYRDADWKVYKQNNPVAASRTTKEEWRKIAPWGSSMHNFGAAFDVTITASPKGKSGLWSLNWLADNAPSFGLKAGRDFGDADHFEIPGGLDNARKRWTEEHPSSSIFTGKLGSASVVALSGVAVLGLLLLAYFLLFR